MSSEEKIVTIAEFSDHVIAELALGELENAGIPAALKGHDTFAEAVPLHDVLLLQVGQQFVAAAREVLEQWEQTAPGEDQ